MTKLKTIKSGHRLCNLRNNQVKCGFDVVIIYIYDLYISYLKTFVMTKLKKDIT